MDGGNLRGRGYIREEIRTGEVREAIVIKGQDCEESF